MNFDYIISGSAGAVVAGRLSEHADVSVLLIEAGASKRSLNVKIPAAFNNQFKTKLDWEFYTEPEPHLDGRVLYRPRAKNVGGCRSHPSCPCGALRIRGHAAGRSFAPTDVECRRELAW